MLNIPDVHRRLRSGLPLTVDEQRELYSLLYEAAMRDVIYVPIGVGVTDITPSFDVVSSFYSVRASGPLPPIKKRCEACGGEGRVLVGFKSVLASEGEYYPRVPVREKCTDCQGTGFKGE